MKIVRTIKELFTETKGISMDELISYPKQSLGFHLGSFLFNNSYEANPIAEKEDVYRLLIMKESSNKEEIAMHFYLFGNGNMQLHTFLFMLTGAVFFLHHCKHFYKKYREGKNALRFHDLDHFRMLHLPIDKIKDAFMIR